MCFEGATSLKIINRDISWQLFQMKLYALANRDFFVDLLVFDCFAAYVSFFHMTHMIDRLAMTRLAAYLTCSS